MKPLHLALGFIVAATMPLQGQTNTVATDPVGYNAITCAAQSDTYLSIPFHKSLDFVGLVQSATGNVINVQYTNTPPFAAGQFQELPTGSNSWFVLLKTGPRGGRYYDITNNGTSSLLVELNDADFTAGEIDGAEICVVPHWTLATAFPITDTNVSFVPSASTFIRQTEILVPDVLVSGEVPGGINLFPTNTYFFYNGAWRKFGQSPTVSFGHVQLRPFTYFFLRNKTTPTAFTPVGAVPLEDASIPLYSLLTSKQDNPIALPRPIDISLNESGLTNGGAFRASPSSFVRLDELLVFTNTGINRPAAETYYVYNNAWRKFGLAPTIDVGTNKVFKAGLGFIIRRGTSSTEAVEFINERNYLTE